MKDRVNNLSPARLELRERVIKVAFASFSEKGVRAITMDDIANLLSISKRTLYEIFRDKESLLRECVLYSQKIFDDYAEEISNGTYNVLEIMLKLHQKALEFYAHANRLFFEDISKYPEVKKLVNDLRENTMDKNMLFFKQGVEQGLFRKDIDFDIIRLLLREQLDFLSNSELLLKYSFPELSTSVLLICLRGISTCEGNRVLERFIKSLKEPVSNFPMK